MEGEQRPVPVGIVGCGYQGRLLARTVAGTGRLQVVACADPVAEVVAAAEMVEYTGMANHLL